MVKTLFILTFLLTTKAYSFTLSVSNGAFYKNNQIKVNVGDNCQNLGVTSSGLLSLAVEAAEQFWNKVPTSRLRLEQGAVVPVAAAFRTDAICSSDDPCVPNTDLIHSHEVLITCNVNATNFANTSIIALTVPNGVAGQNITSSTLLINDNAGNQFQSKSRAEQISIIAHEIGHAIGLGHSPVADSLMYFRSIATRYRLGWDDIDGLTFLYPVEQPISGCGTVDLKAGPRGQIAPLTLGLLFALMAGYALRKSSKS